MAQYYLKGGVLGELKKDPEKRMSELIIAIRSGDADRVKKIIGLDTALNSLLDAPDSNGQTPLHNAARFDQVETAVALIELGANVDARNNIFDTPLHVACKYGANKTAAILIDLGASISARGLVNKTPLHAATAENNVEGIRLLLKNGASPFFKTSRDMDYGNTPLHMAAWFGKCESIKMLLNSQLYPDGGATMARLRERKNREYNTALHLAAYNGHVQAARCLVERWANMDAKGKHGRRPIHVATVQGHAEVVRVLIDHGAVIRARSGQEKPDFWQTPIHLAAFHGHINVIDVLLAKEPRLINMRSHVHGQTPLLRAAGNFQCDCIAALIKRGADVNAVDDLGQTALTIIKGVKFDVATFRIAANRQRTVKLLLETAAQNNKISRPIAIKRTSSSESDDEMQELLPLTSTILLPKINLTQSLISVS